MHEPLPKILSHEEIALRKERLDPRIQRKLAAANAAFSQAETQSGKAAVALDLCGFLATDAAEAMWLVISSSPAFLEGRDTLEQRLKSMDAARDEQIAIMRENNEAFGFNPDGFDADASEVVTRSFAETFARLSGAPVEGGRA